MAGTYVVFVYESGLIRAMQTDGKRWNYKEAKQIERVARAIAPKNTGRLAASHRTVQFRGALGRFDTGFAVEAEAPYAGYVHGGVGPARPHPPRRAMVLPGRGGSLSGTRFIRYRGAIPANPWLRRAGRMVVSM